jgi:hypothetical protein
MARRSSVMFAGLEATDSSPTSQGACEEAGSPSAADSLEAGFRRSWLILLRSARVFRRTVIRQVKSQLVFASAAKVLRDVG